MGKRARKSVQEKVRILEESKTLGILETARKYEISYQTLKNWLDVYAVSGLEGLKTGGSKLSPEIKRLQLENQRLKEIVADKELELKIKNELLKKTLSHKRIEK
jgi:putative transposase